jgi:membrane protease YdiL (CAAX protease family)
MHADEPMTAAESKSKSSVDWPIIAFFVIAYGIAWGLILVFNAVAAGSGIEDGFALMEMTESLELESVAGQLTVPGWLLYLLTRIQDFSFTIAGLIVTAVVAGRAGLRILGKKFNPRLGGWRWYGAALLLPYGLFGLAALLAIAGDGTILDSANLSLESLGTILFSAQAGLIFYMLLRGGLGEEPGLRGFALPRLQLRHGPTVASLIIGLLWAGWHIPVYIRSDAGSVVVSLLLAFTFSFLFTYFYNNARENLWVVIMLHAGINAGDNAFEVLLPGLSELDWQIPAYLGMLIISIVLGIIMWRRSHKEPFKVTSVYQGRRSSTRPKAVTQDLPIRS